LGSKKKCPLWRLTMATSQPTSAAVAGLVNSRTYAMRKLMALTRCRDWLIRLW